MFFVEDSLVDPENVAKEGSSYPSIITLDINSPTINAFLSLVANRTSLGFPYLTYPNFSAN